MIGSRTSVPWTVPRSSSRKARPASGHHRPGACDKPAEGFAGARTRRRSPALSGDTRPLLRTGRDVPRRPL